VQLALVGFAAIYLPVLLLFGVTEVTEDETTSTVDGVEVTQSSTADRSPWVLATVVALGPVAAALAWWWSGRAVGPIDRVRRVAEEIEDADRGRRIALDRGPDEVVALAASFDAMLDRLEEAAVAQRRLIEETSHELRTPLAVLATNADVLLARPADPADAGQLRQGIERSRAAVARMQATIDQLLVEAREPADLVAVVRSVMDEAAALAAPRDVTVGLTAPATATCPIDEPTVRRAVLNLVDNAVRHAPAGTAVDVEVRAGGPDDRVLVTVTDHGPGVPPDRQERIFERFWHEGEGAGLGLPIARQVAEAHGGTLTVRSPLPTGPGASFTLALPQLSPQLRPD
jgi:signal transduction histidine kinase